MRDNREKIMEKFDPLKDAVSKVERLENIKEPPCKKCKHFDPHIGYKMERINWRMTLIPDSIILCVSPEMHPDFSCFQPHSDTINLCDND